MKNKLKKLYILLVVPTLAVGFAFLCGFALRLPKGAYIDGVDVGGMTRAAACALLRGRTESALKEKSLTVYGKKEKYVFTYPEISYKDDLQKLLKGIRRGGSYDSGTRYYLNGLSEIASAICLNESQSVVEPYARFNAVGEPFTYIDGSDGVKADKRKLTDDIKASLSGGFGDVYVSVKAVKRRISPDQLKKDTRLLSSFTTYFDGENSGRSHNIRLAAESINGIVLKSGQSFSFNETVGARTAERGYLKAKIIERGEFVEGVGGGVCQVSTTLFNAALLSGCAVTEFHPHSLSVGYVAPSRDAMVSGSYYDLKFENVTGGTIYIRSYATENSVTFKIFGRDEGTKYSFSSKVTGFIPAPEELTDDPALVKEGKDGILSEGYLTVTRNGISVTKLYRRDRYAPVKRVSAASAPPEDGTEAETDPIGAQTTP